MNRSLLRLFILAALALVFPFFLRRRPRVERRITILAPPGAIFPFLNDLRNWPLWTAWSRRDEIHYSYGEVAVGFGAEQRWVSRNKTGAMRIIKTEPDERIDYELDLDHAKYHLFGRIDLQPDGACTRVTWKCVWQRAENPYRRYVDLLLRWMIARDFDSGLENLKAVVENAGARGLADT